MNTNTSTRWQKFLKSLKKREVAALPLGKKSTQQPEVLENRIAPAVTFTLGGSENSTFAGDGASDNTSVFNFDADFTGFYNSGGLTAAGFAGGDIVVVNSNEVRIRKTVIDGGTITFTGGGGADDMNFNAGLQSFDGLLASDYDTMADLPALTIGGGGLFIETTADDVTLTGNITKSSGGDATAEFRASGSVIMNSGADITSSSNRLNVILNADRDASGSGGVFIVSGGTSITTNGGDFTIGGGSSPSTTAVFGPTDKGVFMDGVTISTGAGNISIRGQGDASSGGGSSIGVDMTGSTSITSTSGNITVVGAGGAVSDTFSMGVSIFSSSSINTATGAISITGTSASTGSDAYGVRVGSSSLVQATGAGTVSVTGMGGVGSGTSQFGVYVHSGGDIIGGTGGTMTISGTGGASSGNSNVGVRVIDAGSSITSNGSAVSVTGVGGGTGASTHNWGVGVDGSGLVSAGGAGAVTVHGTGGGGAGSLNYGLTQITAGTITSGGGNVSVTGIGGNGNSTAHSGGIYLDTATITAGGSGSVTVVGTASAATVDVNVGLDVRFSATITSSGGDVSVTATGGPSTNGTVAAGSGVRVFANGQITAGGSGNVTVTGTGGAGANAHHQGVSVNGYGFESNLAKIGASNGTTTITAISGNTLSPALDVGTSSQGRILPGGNNAIIINADSIAIGASGSINSGTATTTINTRTAGTFINLGGADVLSGSPLTLGLTDAELDLITAGTLQIGSASSGAITVSAAISHTNTNAITLTAGTGLNINLNANFTTAGGAVTFSNAVVVGSTATVDTTNSNGVPLGAEIVFSGATTLNAALTATAGNGVGAGQIAFNSTVDGASALTLNSQFNTFGTIVGGTTPLASISSTAIGGSGAGTAINGNVTTTGTQTYAAGRFFNNTSTSTVTTTNSAVTFNGQADLGDPFTVSTGSGNVTFGGGVRGNFQPLTVNSTGITAFDGIVGSFRALGSLTTDAGGTTTFNNTVDTSGAQSYGDNVIINGTSTMTGSAVTFGGTTTLNAGLTVSTGAGNITFTGAVNGGQALVANSTGATLFSTTVGATTPLASLTTDAGGTTTLTGNVTTTGAQSFGEAVTVAATSTLGTTNANISFGGSITGASFGLTLGAGTGAVSLGGAVSLSALTSTSASINALPALTIGAGGLSLTTTTGGFTQSGALTVTGAATLAAGAANDITLNNASNVFSTVGVTSGATVSVRDDGGFDLAASNVSTLFTVQSAGAISQSGALNGTGGLTKEGAGTMTLSLGNGYTGATTVNAGTLLVNGSTNVASAVSVNNTATLGGSGTVNGTVSVASGGFLAPGNSPAILNSGNVTFTSGSTFTAEVNGATAGTQYDQLNVTGSVNLGGATLSTSGTITSSAGQQIILVANDGADAITGTFSGLAEGATVTINSVDFYLSYIGGTGNDVVLAQAESSVTLSGGNVTFSDVSGANTNDNLTITLVGANVRFNDPLNAMVAAGGATQVDAFTVDIPLASITGAITFNGSGGDDVFTVDFTGGDVIPTGGVTFNGGAGGNDSLVITGGTTGTVTHSFTNANDGSITLVGALAGTITYTGLEPVTDNLSATDRVFTFTGGAETVTLVDDAGATMTIDSTLGESVTFANPSNSLTVDLTSGADVLTVISMDAAYAGSLTITSDGGDTATIAAGLPTLSLVSVTAATINLNSVTTTGVQTYTGAITLQSSTTLASSGAVTLAGTLNGTTAATESLTINAASGSITLGGAIGGTTSLLNFTATSGAAISLPAITLGGALSVTSTGAITVGATLTAAGTIALDGTDVTGAGDIAGAGGTTVTNTGTASTLSGVISGGTLTKAGGGTLALSGANTYGATTISAGTLQIGAGGTTGTLGSGAVANSGTLAFNRSDAISVSNVISGTGAVTQDGAGNTTLSGANTYDGTTTINAGTITLGDAAALGSTVGNIVVASGGTLDLNGLAVSENLQLAGMGVGGLGALVNTSGTAATASGTVALSAAAGIGGTGSITLSGVVSGGGAGTLTKVGTGTVTLSNTNTYTGATAINEGTVSVGVASNLGGGSLITLGAGATNGRLLITGGTAFSTAKDVTITNTGTIEVTNTAGATINGVVGGAALVKDGTQLLTLTGANTYIGGTTVAAGSITAGNNDAFGTGAVTMNTGAVRLNVAGFTLPNDITLANGVAPGSGLGAITGPGTLNGNLTINGNTTAGGHLDGSTGLTINGTITSSVIVVQRVGTVNYNNTINSAAGFSLTGTANWGASNILTSGAPVLVSASGAATWNLGAFDQTIGTLNLTGNGGAGTVTTTTGTLTLTGDVTNGGNFTHTINGLLSLGGGTRTFNVTDGTLTPDVTVNAVVSNGSLTKSGAGNLRLTGASTYAGVTSINAGVLEVTTLADGGVASSIGASTNAATNLVFNNGANNAILRYVGTTASSTNRLFSHQGTTGLVTIENNAAGANIVTFSNSAALDYGVTGTTRLFALGGSNTGDNVFSPQMTDNGAGLNGFSKGGAGTWVIPTANTFSGAAAVNLGVLKISNGAALGNTTGATTMANAAAALNILGNISVPENMTINGGGITNTGSIRSISGNNTLTGLITLATQARINADAGSVLTLDVASGSAITSTNLTIVLGGAGSTIVNDPITVGTGGITRQDPLGTTTVNGANVYTGATTVVSGTLTYGGTLAAGGNLVVGNTAAATAVFNMASSGTVNVANVQVGTNATATGAIYHTAGTLAVTSAAATTHFQLGAVASGYGYYSLSGTGVLNVNEMGIGGNFNDTRGVFDMTGGTLNNTGFITVGRGGLTSSGVMNVLGGTVNLTGAVAGSKIALKYGATAGASAVLNIGPGATVTGPALTTYTLDLAAAGATAGTFGIANVAAGATLAIGGIIGSQTLPTGTLYINGGTLKPTIANVAFGTDAEFDSLVIGGSGATIDNNGLAVTISRPITDAAGNGVTTPTITTAGTGYVGVPLVQITGGGGTGATAYATMSGGVITGIVVTNPGTGYTAAPTFTLVGGGGTGAAITGVAPVANPVGALTYGGTSAGNITESGTNTYTGQTNINAGTVTAGSNGLFGTVAGKTVINSGATFNINGNRDFGQEQFELSGTGVGGLGALINNGATAQNAVELVKLIGNATIGGTGRFDIRVGTGAAVLDLGGFTLTKIGANYVPVVGGSITDGNIIINVGSMGTETTTTAVTGTGSITVNSGATFASWNQSGAFTRPIVLNTGGTLSDVTASAPNTLGSAISLAGNATITVLAASAANGLNLTGIISGAGTLTKTGVGTLFLSSANTYSSSTTISAGTVSIGADTGLGTAPGAATPGHLTINGGTLLTTASFTLDANRGIFLGAPAASANGTFSTNTGTTLTYNGIIADNGTGADNLVKTGPGTMVLGGVNTYTGTTTVNAGILSISSDASLGTAPGTPTANIILSGGGTLETTASMTLNTNRSMSVGTGGGVISTPTSIALAYAGAITGANSLTKIGNGTLTLTGVSSIANYMARAGTTVIDAGGSVTSTVFTSIGVQAGDSATVTVQNGGQYISNGDFNVSDLTGSNGILNISGATSVVSARTLFVGKSGNSTGTVNQTDGTFTTNGAPGDWRIGGAGSAADAASVGIYNLIGGTLNAAANLQVGAFGTGSLIQTGGIATLGGYTVAGRFAGGVGTISVSAGTMTSTAQPFFIVGEEGTGTLNVSSTGSITANTLSIAHAAGGVGTANIDGGTVAVSNVQKGTGTTATLNFNGGTLQARQDNATFLTGLNATNVKALGGTLDTNGFNVTIAQNMLEDGVSTGGTLTKIGAGIATLSGAANTFAIGTITGGTLDITGAHTAAAGIINANSGGTLTGTGSVAGTVNVNTGGSISAGTDGTVGTFTVNTLNFNGGTYKADIIGAANDVLVVTGTASANAGTAGIFTLNNAASGVAASTVFQLIDMPGVVTVSNQPLTGAAAGATTTVDGQNATYTYLSGSGGNDFALVVDGAATYTGTAGNDTFEVRRVNLAGDDVVQVYLGLTLVDSRPAAGVGTVTIDGTDGDDTAFINYGGSGGVHNFNTVFNGGNQTVGDSLSIGGATVTTVTHNFTSDNDGSIVVVDGAGTRSVTYTGLEPVTDNLNATNRVFTFTGAGETVTLSDDVTPGDNVSFINSTLGESVTFTNPTASLTINLTNGSDTLNVEGLDSSFNANVTITGDGGDNVVFQTNDTDLDAGNLSITGIVNVSSNRTVTTTGDVTITATGSITDGNAGTVNFVADDASFTADGGVDLDTTIATLAAATVNNAISIRETNSVALNLVDAGTATFTLTAVGAVTDNNAAANNVAAGTWNVTAGTGIGDGDSIETTIGTLNATNTTNDIDVTNVGALTITGASVTGATGDIFVTADLSIDPAANITSNAGNVTITSTTADILGNVGFLITGASVSLIAGGNIGSAGNNVRTTATALLFTGGAMGDVFITETDGATVTGTNGSGNATLTTTTGNWTINSTGVDATGDVTLIASAGDILRSGATGDVTGNTLTFTAGGADGDVGVTGTALFTSGSSIVFTATGTGEVALTETNGSNITGSAVTGNINITSTTGDLTINSTGVDTAGNVNLTASAGDILRSGAAADITGGTLTLTAGNPDGDLGAAGNELLTSGTQINFAGAGTGDVFLTESDGANVSGATGSGNISLTTTTGDWNVNLTGINTTGNVSLTASAGDIQRTGIFANLAANTVTLTAGGADGDIGVGGTSPMITTATSVVFAGSGTGDVLITEANGANVSGSTGSGNITLISSSGDWTVNSTGVSTTGNVTMTASAGDLLRQAANPAAVVAGNNVTLTAGGADGDIGASALPTNRFRTDATNLVFTGTGTGDVNITELTGATVTGATASGQINLTTAAGDWTVVGSGLTTTGNQNITAISGDILRSGAGAIISGAALTLFAGGADGDLGAAGTPLLTTVSSIVFTGGGTGEVLITETDGASINGSTGSGDITLISTTGDWTIDSTGVDTTGNATITAGGDILTTGGAAEISANVLTLTAGGADGDIGDIGAPILTAASATIFTGTGTGEVLITEADGATITGATGSGDITLISTTGNWTVVTPGVSTTGNVSMTASDGDLLQSGVGVLVSGNLLTLTAGGVDGGIGTTANEFRTSGTTIDFTATGTGNVYIIETNDAFLSGVTGAGNTETELTSGGDWNVNLLALSATNTVADITATGAVLDNNGAANNITALSAVFTTGTGVGTSADFFDTALSNLEASGGASGIFIAEADALNIGGVSGMDGVSSLGSEIEITSGDLTISETIESLVEVTLTSSGFITETVSGAVEAAELITTSIGAQTLTGANTLGIFTATSANAAITLNETDGVALNAVNAGSGNVTITLAAGALTDNNVAATNITGSAVVITAPGGIDTDTAATTLTATTTDNDILIDELNDVALNLINAGTGDVTITAGGAITDNNAALNNIVAANLTLTGATGITSIETDVDTLVATVSNGSISINETDALQIIGAGVTTTGGNGSITIVAGGTLTVDAVVSADGSGNVTLTSSGAETNILVNTAVTSVSGNIDIAARGNIELDANVATTGDVSLTADSNETATGAINYTSGTVTANDLVAYAAEGITLFTAVTTLMAENTISNFITITENDDAAVNLIENDGRDVTLTSASGAFTDNNGGANNILAAALYVSAVTGINFDTTITTLASADVTGTGDINIDDLAGGLDVVTATAADGDITITADGGDLNVSLANASANLNLSTTTSGDVNVDNVTAGITVTIVAAGRVDELAPNDGTADITALNVDITAGTGIGTNSGGALETALTGTLDALTGTGGVFIDNSGIFAINDVTVTTSGNIVINGDADITVNGTVNTTDDITIHAVEFDDAGGPYTNNLTVNGTVGSAGTNNVTLRAGDDLTIAGTGVVNGTTSIEVCAGYNDLDTRGVLTLDGTINIAPGGSLIFCASGDIIFGPPAVPGDPVINAPGSNVTLTTTTGNIYDNNDNDKPAAVISGPAFGGFVIDIVANILTLNAPNGYIGEDGDTIESTVNSVTANAGNGGVYLWNTSALTVAAITAAGTGGNSIDISSQGTMTINGPVAETNGDDIKFFAVGATSDLSIQGSVNGSGNMSFLAGDNVLISGLGAITNTGTLTVSLEAGYPDDLTFPNNPSADLTIDGTVASALNLSSANLRLTAPRDVILNGGGADVTTLGSFTVEADRDSSSSTGTGGAFRQFGVDSTVQVGSVSITASDVELYGTIDAGVGDIDVFASTAASNIYLNNNGAGLNLNLSDLLALRTLGGTITLGENGNNGTVFVGALGTVGLGLIDANYVVNGSAIDFNGGIVLHDDRTLTLNATGGTITAAGGVVTDVIVAGPTGTLIVNASDDATLNTRVTNLGESSVNGDLVLNNTNTDLTVIGDVDTLRAFVTVGTGTFGVALGFTFSSYTVDNSGTMTITADDIALVGDLDGGGILTLQGNTIATSFGFGDGAGMFEMTVLEVENILDGFDKIIIGRTGQTGNMHFMGDVGTEVTFLDNVQIIGGKATVTVEDTSLIGDATDVGFDIDAAFLIFSGTAPGITTLDQPIDINAAVVLDSNTIIDSTTAGTGGGANGFVRFIGTINGAFDLTVLAEDANIQFLGNPTPVPSGTSVGGDEALASITATGGQIKLHCNIRTSGDQVYTGSEIVMSNGNRTSTAGNLTYNGPSTVTVATRNTASLGNITFNGDVNGGGVGALNLTAGSVNFVGSVGDITPLESLKVYVTGTLTIGDALAVDSMTIEAGEIDFDGGAGSVSILGGILDIKVKDIGTAIRIGDAEGDLVGGAPTLNFSDDDIAALADGMSAIKFTQSGTDLIVVAEGLSGPGEVHFLDPLTLTHTAKDGVIQIKGGVFGDTVNGDVTIKTGALGRTELEASVTTTAGGNIDITNGIVATAITLDSSGGDGDIFIRGKWAADLGGESLTVDSGAGNITILSALGLSAARTPVLGPVILTSGGSTTFGASLSAESLLVNGGGTTRLGGSVTTIGAGGQVYDNAVLLPKSASLTSKHADGVVEFNSTIDSVAPKLNSLTITNKYALAGTLAVDIAGSVGVAQRLGTLRINTTGEAENNGSVFAKNVAITASAFTVNSVDTVIVDTSVNAQTYRGIGTFLGAINSERLAITSTEDIENLSAWTVSGSATINTDKDSNVSITNIGPSNVFGELSAAGYEVNIATTGDVTLRTVRTYDAFDFQTTGNLITRSLRVATDLSLSTTGGSISQIGAIVATNLSASAPAGSIALDNIGNRITSFINVNAGTTLALLSGSAGGVGLMGTIAAGAGDMLLVANRGSFVYGGLSDIVIAGGYNWTMYTTRVRTLSFDLELQFAAHSPTTELGVYPTPPTGGGNVIVYQIES